MADRTAYNALRDELVVQLDAITKEREALGATSSPPLAPQITLDEVLRLAGGWGRIIEESDVALQRKVLGFARYTVEIGWTPLGESLHGVVEQVAA